MVQSADMENEIRDPMTDAVRQKHYAPSREAFESLLKFQWASPEKLSTFQENNTKRLISHAAQHVPYYHDRLNVLRGGTDGIDLARWLDVPVLTRADLVADAEAMWASYLPPEHGMTRMSRSSGTTGGRVEVVRTELQDSVNACSQFRFWYACNLNYSHNHGIIRAVDPNVKQTGNENLEEPKWGPPWLPFRERGNRNVLSVLTPPARQMEWLAERAPIYLNTMPSNLLALAHHVRDHGGDLAGVTGVLTGGEVLTADIRAQVHKWLDIDMFDAMASSECGVIATQCLEGGGGYHIEAEAAVVEVLQEDGTPCRPGETGLLTVTPLYSYAMPLIRYQSDDWVTVGEICACGRSLPVIGEIVGRDRTLFQFADGVKMRLEPDSDTLFRHLGPRRWQIVQTGPDQIEIRVAEMRIEQSADFDAAIAYVRKLLGRNLNIECVFVPVLGMAPSGKFDRMIRTFS